MTAAGRRIGRGANQAPVMHMQKRGIKDIDRSDTLHPHFVGFLPEMKLIPRTSFTLRIPSSSWTLTDGSCFTTLGITGEVIINRLLDYVPNVSGKIHVSLLV